MKDNPVLAVFFLLGTVAALDPGANLFVFMGAVVVDDQMQAKTVWSFRVDHLEEGQPFLVCVPGCGVVQDFSIQVVQSCKEGDGSMARVVMRGGSHMPNAER